MIRILDIKGKQEQSFYKIALEPVLNNILPTSLHSLTLNLIELILNWSAEFNLEAKMLFFSWGK